MQAIFALTVTEKRMGEDDEKNVVVDLKRERAKKRVELLCSADHFDRYESSKYSSTRSTRLRKIQSSKIQDYEGTKGLDLVRISH